MSNPQICDDSNFFENRDREAAPAADHRARVVDPHLILSCEKESIVVRFKSSRPGEERAEIPVSSVDEIVAFVQLAAGDLNCSPQEIRVSCSSSMDFPHEYTTNPSVLALAYELRG